MYAEPAEPIIQFFTSVPYSCLPLFPSPRQTWRNQIDHIHDFYQLGYLYNVHPFLISISAQMASRTLTYTITSFIPSDGTPQAVFSSPAVHLSIPYTGTSHPLTISQRISPPPHPLHLSNCLQTASLSECPIPIERVLSPSPAGKGLHLGGSKQGSFMLGMRC